MRKKAILTSIKIIKKSPEYIPDFLDKIGKSLEETNQGIRLSCMAFLENVIAIDIDDTYVKDIVALMPKIVKLYRSVMKDYNMDT